MHLSESGLLSWPKTHAVNSPVYIPTEPPTGCREPCPTMANRRRGYPAPRNRDRRCYPGFIWRLDADLATHPLYFLISAQSYFPYLQSQANVEHCHHLSAVVCSATTTYMYCRWIVTYDTHSNCSLRVVHCLKRISCGLLLESYCGKKRHKFFHRLYIFTSLYKVTVGVVPLYVQYIGSSCPRPKIT
jgi:hypothetical protein